MSEIDILYEDRSVLICVKPVGVLSQCDGQEDMPASLVSQVGGAVYPIHRLDRNVGGVMAFARTAKSAASLSAQIQNGAFVKRYLAAVPGIPKPDSGEMKDLLFRDSRSGRSFVVGRERKGVKEARLAYRTIDSAEGKSLVLVRLYTGRTHQIRVQFASRKMPLLGDGKYGSREKGCDIALWSCRLTFTHPATGVEMSFRSLPDVSAYPWKLFDFGGVDDD
jgi:Pseudouridylate synthases, 23S RNA-specific